MAQATLLGMPLELLVHLIATYLPTKDLGALRLTSKYLEIALFDTFAKEFFTKKQFMLSTFSLDVLVGISKHKALSPFVQHVIIGLEQYTTSSAQNLRWMDADQSKAFRDGWADQYTLTTSGRDREMLAEAFRNFPCLKTVGIRDYDGLGRTRDEDRWQSYGVPTVARQTGNNLGGASAEYATRAFTLLLQSLADAKNLVSGVEVITRTPHTGLTDFAFFMPAATNVKPVLEGLQQLLLTISFSDHLSLPDLDGFSFGANGVPREPTFFETFLACTPALKHLRLNFQHHPRHSPHYILEGFCVANNLLPNLERFELGMTSVTPDLLFQVISSFAPNLRHVSLWKIQLDQSVLPRWIDDEGRFHPWPRFLKDLSNDPKLDLRSVQLGCLTQWARTARTAAPGPVRVKFANGQVSQEGVGDMKVFVPQLIDSLRVQWPAVPSDGPGPVSDDVDMDEDEDEDEEDGTTDEDEEEV